MQYFLPKYLLFLKLIRQAKCLWKVPELIEILINLEKIIEFLKILKDVSHCNLSKVDYSHLINLCFYSTDVI